MKILSFDAERNIIQINKKLKTLIQLIELFILGMILNITMYMTYPAFKYASTDQHKNTTTEYIQYTNIHLTNYKFWFISPYHMLVILTILFVIAVIFAFFYYILLGIVIIIEIILFVNDKYNATKKWLKRHWKVKILIPKIRYVDKP